MTRFALIVLATLAPVLSQAAPIEIGSRLEPMVDGYLIDTLKGDTHVLHAPQSAGTAITLDKPWEGLFCGYFTVMKTAGEYRLYYRGNPTGSKDGDPIESTCYARSDDAIHWTKPDVGIFELNGTKSNNVVLAGMAPFSHNFAPFEDTRPGVPADEKYKAIAGINPGGLSGFASADGVHWRRIDDKPIFTDKGWCFDSQNNAFWSEAESKYVLYYRRASGGFRSVARATSDDFLHWSKPTQMTFSQGTPTKEIQIYTNQTEPYFRAPHVYIGLAARFMPGRAVLPKEAADAAGVDAKSWLRSDCSDTVLLTTRGGTHYDRTFLQAFVRPGPDPLNWESRGNYAARGIVQTGPTEMSLYVERRTGMKSVYLERMTLRLDGFASIHADADEGQMITKPLTFTGDQLHLNFATSAAGSLRVEILDAEKDDVLAESVEMIGDSIDRPVQWKRGGDLAVLNGKAVRLRFDLREADLYAVQFLKK